MSSTAPQQDTSGSPWERHHRLARALEHAGWQVKDMQAYLRVSEGTMTNYLKGRTKRIPVGVLRDWAFATGTRWQWLLDGTGPWLRDGSEDGDRGPDPASDVPVRGSGWNRSSAIVPAPIIPLHRAA